MVLSIHPGTVQMQVKIAVFSRHSYGFDALNELFTGAAVLDEICDGANLEAVLLGEFQQRRQSRHRAIVVHDFADDPDWAGSRQHHQIHRGFRMTGTLEHPAGLGAQGENVARLYQIIRHRRG
jgi:hypothetical protein